MICKTIQGTLNKMPLNTLCPYCRRHHGINLSIQLKEVDGERGRLITEGS
jgi:hypothetical protein